MLSFHRLSLLWLGRPKHCKFSWDINVKWETFCSREQFRAYDTGNFISYLSWIIIKILRKHCKITTFQVSWFPKTPTHRRCLKDAHSQLQKSASVWKFRPVSKTSGHFTASVHHAVNCVCNLLEYMRHLISYAYSWTWKDPQKTNFLQGIFLFPVFLSVPILP